MLFDENEEDFLARIPYPEALSRDVLHVGETWKLYLNVDYLRGVFAQSQADHETAVVDAHDEHASEYGDGESEGRRDCFIEIRTAITRILKNNKPGDHASEIYLYFMEFDYAK